MKTKLKEKFNDKNILVTGGTGSIGSEIINQLLKYNPRQIRIYSRDESKHFFLQQELEKKDKKQIVRYLIGDVRDKDRLDNAFEDIDIVFHVAALKHVPFCEYNPYEAVKTNIQGTQNVIDLAIKHNVQNMVAISTDKAVYPNTIMGITKLLMERLVVGAYNHEKTKFAVVRFGNVLNSRGSVIPTWIKQIKKGQAVTVTDKRMRRFFMSIPNAVDLVLNATAISKGEETFVLKMEEKNIYKLAKEIIRKYSKRKKIKIQITGRREREKIAELLFTKEEKKYMIEKDTYCIILPNKDLYKQRLSKY